MMTFGRINVPLANPLSSTGFPESSTRQTMIAPTFRWMFSASTVARADDRTNPAERQLHRHDRRD
jgi:hypothetical protein